MELPVLELKLHEALVDAAASIGLQSCGLRIRSSLWLAGRTSGDGWKPWYHVRCPEKYHLVMAKYGKIWQINGYWISDIHSVLHPISYNLINNFIHFRKDLTVRNYHRRLSTWVILAFPKFNTLFMCRITWEHIKSHERTWLQKKSNYRPTNKTYQNLSRPFSGPESTHRPVAAVPTGSQDRIHFS